MKYKIQHLPLFCQALIKTDGITQSKSIYFPSIPKEEDGSQQMADSGLCYKSRPKRLPRGFRGARPAQDLLMDTLVHVLSL